MARKIKQTKTVGINVKWFVDALKDVEKSQADLARHLGISPSQISKLFGGGRRVQLDEVELIAAFINKPIRDVLINLGVRLDENGPATAATAMTKQVPIVGKIEPNGTVIIDLEKKDRMVDPPGRVPPGTAAVIVPPRMADGALAVSGLYFFVIPDRVDPGAVGRLSVIRQQRGPWLLRTLHPGIEPGRYDLTGPGGVEENQEIIAAGPILLIRP